MTPNPDLAYSGGISLVGSAVPKSPPPTVQTNKLTLQTPSTPRIDISRASSSSHHEDSRDSSPERELFEGQDPASAKLGLGFREEGEKDFQDFVQELCNGFCLRNKPFLQATVSALIGPMRN